MRATSLTKRLTRKRRVRARISGTEVRPRVSVFKSNKYIYAQIINDEKGVTLAQAHGKDAGKVGEELGEKAGKAKIKMVVLDRSGYKYHGSIKRLADAIRSKGIEF